MDNKGIDSEFLNKSKTAVMTAVMPKISGCHMHGGKQILC